MGENEIRGMLADIVESGRFPSDTFDVRHIEKIGGFQHLSQPKVRFWVERHPHLFGAPSLGKASSAFVTKH